MRTQKSIRIAVVMLGGAGLLASTPDAMASDAATPPAIRLGDASGTTSRDANGAEAAQSRNAARSRMRECGHQWSAMKKNGTASGMTWKDFSQGCLAAKQ